MKMKALRIEIEKVLQEFDSTKIEDIMQLIINQEEY
jgi:hypothetical protein